MGIIKTIYTYSTSCFIKYQLIRDCLTRKIDRLWLYSLKLAYLVPLRTLQLREFLKKPFSSILSPFILILFGPK